MYKQMYLWCNGH